ncbi:class I SAM-dependent methyltransferase [Aestuariibius insulae]
MTIADYMALCLGHPDHGYYMAHDPFGAAGDFTTAPEISQMFGELLGLALAQAWLDQGGGPAALVELGPGRGTLMADALRATAAVPGFHEALSVHLVEMSPHLRTVQRKTLAGWDIVFHDDVTTLPELPLLVVANEFFDALPIRQFLRQHDGWSERLLMLKDNALSFAFTEPRPVPDLDWRLADMEVGQIVEMSATGPAIMGAIAEKIAAFGGAALMFDYGDAPSRGDTLQALYKQQPNDPLAHPGKADLTAHVDFGPLAEVAEEAGLRVQGPVAQGVFLERLGITDRAQMLARNLDDAALKSHIAAHRRLTHPGEMGHLFKGLGLTPPGAPPLPGFDP